MSLRTCRVGAIFLSLLVTVAVAIAPNIAIAEPTEFQGNIEDSVRSLQKDAFMGVMLKRINNGSPLLDLDGTARQKRQQLNYDILSGADVPTHSLFDRFGGDLSFSYYLGEQVVRTGLPDKIYTVLNGTEWKDVSIKSVADIVSMTDTAYTNKFYKNRPPLKDESTDPRVKCYSSDATGKSSQLGVANYLLKTSELITGLTAIFASDGVVTRFADLLRGILELDAIRAVLDVIRGLMPFLGVSVIIFLVSRAFSLVSGSYSLKRLIGRLLSMALSIGLIVAIAISPTKFLDITQKILTIGDRITASAISDTMSNDEIVHSSSTDNVLEAALWEDSVFKPWVRGMFGGVDYNDLYTTSSGKDNAWPLSEQSSKAIGDISVPVSSNPDEDIKNWAALAYSCTSEMHIPAVQDERKDLVSPDDSTAVSSWPKAKTLGGTEALYADDMRWVDASLKVGSYDSDSPAVNLDRYVDTRDYKFDGVAQGAISIWLAVLLIPILVIGFKKTASAIMFLAGVVTLLADSIANVVSADSSRFSLGSSLKKIGQALLAYIWYLVLIVVLVSLYKTAGVSSNPLLVLFYLAVSIYLTLQRPAGIRDSYEKIRRAVVSKASDLSVSLTSLRDGEMLRAAQEGAIPTSSTQLAAGIAKRLKSGETANAISEDSEPDTSDEDDSDYEKSYMGDYSTASMARNKVILADQYMDAIERCNGRDGDFPDAKKRYRALIYKIKSCSTNQEVARAINDHRFSRRYDPNGSKSIENSEELRDDKDNINARANSGNLAREESGTGSGLAEDYTYNQKMDYRILDIPYEFSASYELENTRANALYDTRASIEGARYNAAKGRANDSLRKRRAAMRTRLMALDKQSNLDSDERQQELRQLEKMAKRLDRESKANRVQSAINLFTDNELGGSIVPPNVKLKILGGLILLYLAGLLLASLFGI